MKCLSFLNFIFRKRRFITENWLCFRACNSRIVTYDQEFCLVVWFCVLITLTESFEKFSFKRRYHDFFKCLGSKSWCCRKHVFVFEIVSLKVWISLWSNYLFPYDFWVKDFLRHYGRKFENFSILGVDFLLF